MTEDLRPPFRQQFDNARDPYTARNALGITSTGGGGPSSAAPDDAEYIVAATDPVLTAERVLTNTASITWDFSVPGQAKANTAGGGGNVSNSGTPTSGQYGRWTGATTIEGIATATVLSDIGAASSADFPAGAWTAWSPTITASSGAFTTVTVTRARYIQLGKTIIANLVFTLTTIGSGTGTIRFTLPVTASASNGGIVHGREIITNGFAVNGDVDPSGTVGTLVAYNGGTAMGAGSGYNVTAVYERG